jgi:membrane associated rhomboid family serine protease
MAEFYRIQEKNRRLFSIRATYSLIAINVAFFFLILIAKIFSPNLVSYLALTPILIIQGKYLWTLITSIFVHASFAHLFFNMISLFFLGTLVEKIIGKKRFVVFFLISGIVAGIFFAVLAGFFGTGIGAKIFGDATSSGVGASGAIFALVGVLTILIPKKKVYLIAGPLLAIIAQSVLEVLLINNALVNILDVLISIYVIFSMFSLVSFNPRLQKFTLPLELSFWVFPIISIIPLIIIGWFVPLPIGNMAHLGGFIAGLVYGVYLKKKYKNKTKYLREHFQ